VVLKQLKAAVFLLLPLIRATAGKDVWPRAGLGVTISFAWAVGGLTGERLGGVGSAGGQRIVPTCSGPRDFDFAATRAASPSPNLGPIFSGGNGCFAAGQRVDIGLAEFRRRGQG